MKFSAEQVTILVKQNADYQHLQVVLDGFFRLLVSVTQAGPCPATPDLFTDIDAGWPSPPIGHGSRLRVAILNQKQVWLIKPVFSAFCTNFLCEMQSSHTER